MVRNCSASEQTVRLLNNRISDWKNPNSNTVYVGVQCGTKLYNVGPHWTVQLCKLVLIFLYQNMVFKDSTPARTVSEFYEGYLDVRVVRGKEEKKQQKNHERFTCSPL